jgi:PAS domain S-box-containing protein
MNANLIMRAFAEAPLAMAIVDALPPYVIIAANDAFDADVRATLGSIDKALLTGHALPDLVPAAAESGLDAVLRDACAGMPQRMVSCRTAGRELRYAEILISALKDADGTQALLYVSLDITESENARRELEKANTRLSGIAAVSHESAQVASDAVMQAAAVAAATTCEGPALLLLADDDGGLTRTASHALPVGVLAESISADRLPSVGRALHTRTTRITQYTMSLPLTERALLGAAHATWLVATPVAGRLAACGVLVTLWRRVNGPNTDDLRALELIAGQVGTTLQHDRLLAAAEDQRARLELILEGMPDSVWILDADGTLARTNPAGERLLELRRGVPLPMLKELSARFDSTGDEPETGDSLGLRRALAGQIVANATAMIRQPWARREVWVHSSAAPLRNASGAIVGAVGVSKDVTDRRRADEAIRLLAYASAELSSTLDYRRSLASVARSAVTLRLADWCIVDLCEPDGSIVRLTVAHRDADNLDLARDLQRHPPRGTSSVFADVFGDGKVRAYARLREAQVKLLAQDPSQARVLESLRPRSLLLVPIVARGRSFGVMQLLRTTSWRAFLHDDAAVAQDLAQRAGMAIDNARLFDEARAADQRKDEFIGVLSHELRTPLTSVMVWAGILRQASDPERIRHAAEVIERNIAIQTALINDLLDLTSISRGKVQLDRADEDLRDILQVAVDIVRDAAASRTVRLVYEPPSAPVPVHVDAKRLQQVFWNILNNAIKFTGADGEITIRVSADREGAVVRIRDSGEGISPDFLPHVFDMFRQHGRAVQRGRAGLGIGLALAKQLVELHGGRIEARSDGKGTGSEFLVSLGGHDGRAVRNALDARPEAPALAGVSVLVIEDVQDLGLGATALLEARGARVIEARNAEEALRLLEHEGVDAVLCDLWMPVMDGFTFIRQVRAHERWEHLPVIAVAALTGPRDVSRIDASGFNGFVRKPFEDAALIAVLRQTLDRAVAARQSREPAA